VPFRRERKADDLRHGEGERRVRRGGGSGQEVEESLYAVMQS
jgi:hypothetical protein